MNQNYLLKLKNIISCCILIMTASGLSSQKLELNKNFWQTDAEVRSVVYDSLHQRYYVGGNFTSLAPYAPNGALVDISSRQRNSKIPIPDGEVYQALSDGKGGWFICGDFNKVGDSSRGKIAHINFKGQVTSLFSGMGFSSSVRRMLLKDSMLYVGGGFKSYGFRRTGLVQFDTLLKVAKSNTTLGNGLINKILSDGKGGWYVCGTFTKIGDSLRNNLAHIDSNGMVDAWNPEPAGTVSDILIDANYLYIGGKFSSIGGLVRYGLASIILSSGNASSWNPSISSGGSVTTMCFRGSTIIVTGSFSSIGGKTRSNIAAVDIVSGLANNWNPGLTGKVNTMVVIGNNLYLGGDFSSVGGSVRQKLACVSLINGTATSWNPKPDYAVLTMQSFGSQLMVGGYFDNLDVLNTGSLVFFDTSTMQLSSYYPRVDGSISSSLVFDGKLYLGGIFRTIDTFWRRNFAIYDLNKKTILPWEIGPTGETYKMAVAGKRLHIAIYGSVSQDNRNGLACFNIKTGKLTNWEPDIKGITYVADMEQMDDKRFFIGGNFEYLGNRKTVYMAKLRYKDAGTEHYIVYPDSVVEDMHLYNGRLFIGGSFRKIGLDARDKVAELDTSTGLATSFVAPVFDKNVYSIYRTDSILLVGGNFTKVGTASQQGCAIINYKNPAKPYAQPSCDGYINGFAATGNKIYACGKFNKSRRYSTPNIFEWDRITNDHTDWCTYPNNEVYGLCLSDDRKEFFAFGNFSLIGGQSRQGIAALSKQGELIEWGKELTVESPGIYDFEIKDTTLFVAGKFSWIRYKGNLINRDGVFSLSTNSFKPLKFDPRIDLYHLHLAHVYTLVLRDSSLYVGGEFKDVAGVQRRNLASLDPVSGKTRPWNPSPNDIVNRILVHDSSLFVGGSFDSLGGQRRFRMGAVGFDSSASLRNFSPTANYDVLNLCKDSGYIYVAGQFTTISSFARTQIARYSLGSLALDAFYPKVAGSTINIKGLTLYDSFVLFGGDFNSVNSTSRKYMASVNRYTGALSSWNPAYDNSVNYMDKVNGNIFSGGTFKRVESTSQQYFASFRKPCAGKSETQIKVSQCGPFTFNGNIYEKSGIYKLLLDNYKGCDSVIILDLTIKDTSMKFLDIVKSNCTPYVLNGISYSHPGYYIQKRTNYMGCDSTIILHLQVPEDTTRLMILSCDSFEMGGEFYKKSGVYTKVLKNRFGCDSIIYLSLKVGYPDSSFKTIRICSNQLPYFYNGQKYTAGGKYVQHLINYTGCDSALNIDLIVNPIKSNTVKIKDCSPYIFNGQLFKTSGTYYFNAISYLNCDSNTVFEFERLNINTGITKSGKTLTAMADSATYQWMDCSGNEIPGAISRSFVAKVPGNYSVKISRYECDTVSSCIEVKSSEISDIVSAYNFKIYPNPTEGIFTVSRLDSDQSLNIKIYDMTGKLIYTYLTDSETSVIDLSGFSGGVYTLRIESGETVYHCSIVKQ